MAISHNGNHLSRLKMTIVDQLCGYKYLILVRRHVLLVEFFSPPKNTLARDLRFFDLHKTKNAYSLENKQQTRCLYAAIIELGVPFCQSL